ncbi:hypothetical protein M514_01518 [Trichuris suis]|uniref:Uncharacterized protein n=1 Tax=Trichuris suis TaxID=68888 RepID=A0A085MJL9_9BILA|nr:hypothetical protein M513_01518 [Trichuris suis]KFD66521.1 hypothetical protein M514_01518 [Trichuris suis]
MVQSNIPYAFALMHFLFNHVRSAAHRVITEAGKSQSQLGVLTLRRGVNVFTKSSSTFVFKVNGAFCTEVGCSSGINATVR